jgi:Bacterial TniB protein
VGTPSLSERLIPLDLSFDVRRRLADLQQWDLEWRHERDRLDQIADRLDINHYVDVLRAEQVEDMQRRIFLQRVRSALEISTSVTKIGYSKLRSHLTAQYASLSIDEKLVWLNNLLFIMTPTLRGLCAKIERIREWRTFGQQRNFLLGALSGMGKTTFLDWWLANAYPAKVMPAYNHVPLIKIDAPLHENTPKPLFQRIIMECGLTWLKHDDEETLLRKMMLCFQQCRVELLIVDEVEHITSHRIRRRLVEISNRTRGIPIICASCHPHRWTEDDPEIAGRWNDYVEMQPYTGERLSQLLAFIEMLLPFTERSHLALFTAKSERVDEKTGKHRTETVAGMAQVIQDLTQGVLKNVMLLILDASRRAIAEKQASLTAKTLEASWRDIKWVATDSTKQNSSTRSNNAL